MTAVFRALRRTMVDPVTATENRGVASSILALGTMQIEADPPLGGSIAFQWGVRGLWRAIPVAMNRPR